MEITSRDNAIVKQAKKLLVDASARRKAGLFLIEGARLCSDAAETGVEIESALFTENAIEKYPSQISQIRQKAKQMYEITNALASYLTDTQNPQGVFCVCKQIQTQIDVKALPLSGKYILLENVQDPGNLGTVIRTAEAFGADGLLLSTGCCDITNPKVVRGSMGGVFRLPIGIVPNVADAISMWNQMGLETYACVADASAEKITDISFNKGSICVIGNEANGLTSETIDACHHSLTIPMNGRAESLNAAVAACVVLWELLK